MRGLRGKEAVLKLRDSLFRISHFYISHSPCIPHSRYTEFFHCQLQSINFPDRTSAGDLDIDVTGWGKGMYVVRLVYNGKTVSTAKVMVE